MSWFCRQIPVHPDTPEGDGAGETEPSGEATVDPPVTVGPCQEESPQGLPCAPNTACYTDSLSCLCTAVVSDGGTSHLLRCSAITTDPPDLDKFNRGPGGIELPRPL